MVILFSMSEVNHKELIATLKEKRFGDMRKWVVQNLDKHFCLEVFMIYFTALSQNSYAILIIAGYQYKTAFCCNKRLI